MIWLKNFLVWCLVFLSSVLIVGAVSELDSVDGAMDDTFVECKTIWHDEGSKWVTLCGDDISKIDEYQRSKVPEVRTVPLVVDDVTADDPTTVVEEIFDEVESGFGIVPKEKKILKDDTPIKKVQPVKITPKEVEKKVTNTFVDVIAKKIDDFFSFPFKFFGLVDDEETLEEVSGEGEGWMLDMGGGHSPDVPQEFLDMLNFEPEKTYYIAQNEQGSSDDNNCLYPQYISGVDGPCKTLKAIKRHDVVAGEAIAVGSGIYNIDDTGLSVKFQGTAGKPIRIFAYEGEDVIIETRNSDKKIWFGGKYTTLEGFDIRCYTKVCMTIWDGNTADHVVVYNNKISEAYEDGIKTTTESSNVLIYRNEFFNIAGEGESVDAFGVNGAWIIQNEFYDDSLSVRDSGAVSWAKGGASGVYYIDNYFHDLTVRNHALILGGCCWNNWAGTAGVDPVATNIHAIRNVFERITIDGTYRYRGAIGVEGCHGCSVIDNTVNDVDVAIGVHATIDGNNRVGSKDVLISGNFEDNIVTERILNLHEDSKDGLVINSNTYCVDNPTVYYTKEMSLEEFQSYGFETGYEPCESGPGSVGIIGGEEREFIEVEPGGDKEFEMNVYTDQIVKDVHGLTKGFGNVIGPFMHPKFLDAYIDEVGVEGINVRTGHKYERYGRGFPPAGVHTKLQRNGAKVMVVIKGIPSEEGIAYCSEFVGTECVTYESSGPAKDMQAWKDYVKDVVRHYNSKGIKYFIIWNEPNFVVENWKEVCKAPGDCWWPTMEEFVDLTVAGVEAVYEVDPSNGVGVDGTSAFFGSLNSQSGVKEYVPIEVFEALDAKGLKATHHYHHYNPDPYTMTPGGDSEQALEHWRANSNAFLGTNMDEFSDGLPGQPMINGDGIHAVSSTMALLANSANYDIDRAGWFQLYSNVHEPGTIQGRFLGWDENMIDRSGIYKPVFWLSKLLHDAPGTLMVDDDLDESDTVRAFTVRNQEGTSYCWYGVNFDRAGKSATIKLTAKNLPTDVSAWLYTTYKIGHEDGNPYHDDVEPEIQALLQPMIDNIHSTPGATWNDYINQAWPIITEINSWESVRPTKTEKVVAGNKAELSTQVTLDYEEVRVICLEKTEEMGLDSGSGGPGVIESVVDVISEDLAGPVAKTGI